MSILIGIKAHDAIILATDSQIIDLANGEHDSVNKIAVIKFGTDEVLIAQAGLCVLTDRVIEIIHEKAKGIRIQNHLSVKKTIEDSIREVQLPFTDKEKEHSETHVSGLIAAYYVNKTAHLDTLIFRGLHLLQEDSKPYAVIGVGDSLGKYLLKDYLNPDDDSGAAMCAAIFAIGKVKEISRFVGGNINVRKIWPEPTGRSDKRYVSKSGKVDEDFVIKFEKKILKSDQRNKLSRSKRVYRLLRTTSDQILKKRFKQYKSELTTLENNTEKE